ncbi:MULTISPECIES: methyltransferase [unclassified Roseofilum]|uniref:methyltransferase n=1 Tax=unclassified Roseofilum TaxID=2620099 RepID=UPI001B090B7D|nr:MULTISPECIES: methyltransferase [unclassified Roseofilum]MBP0011286.1 methyltransferase [Roseofilum sp. Belize Diploria]MBP0014583.1 methyltransferase [Roseofilum sp. SID3]MBP0026064.1 methyltransferase [Roseofilum sp. SID2]MBP0033965.1 methyltransferase [Roseofilum sp. Belize BBD 4]MBP0038279.1 methyltransferase [Roseofilum sp. SID1]
MNQKSIYLIENINLASSNGIAAKTPFSQAMCEGIDLQHYHCLLDVGCGSGIIGIYSLLNRLPFVYFNDIQPEAIGLTQYNLKKEGISSDQYQIIQGAFDSIDLSKYPIDLITFNPPQLPTDWVNINIFKEECEKKFRDGGKDGKAVINRFFQWLSGQNTQNISIQLGVSSVLAIDSFLKSIEQHFGFSGAKKHEKTVPVRQILYPIVTAMSQDEKNARDITFQDDAFYKKIYILEFNSKR